MRVLFTFLGLAILLGCHLARAQTFRLPTSNRALFERDGGPRFFTGTVGRSWESGAFGCVRSEGFQFHEGLDIRCVERDDQGEPTDEIRAVADGTVAYVNRKTALSNFGKYVLVLHRVEGLEVHSLYAHLSEIRDSVRAGAAVRSGEVIARMGRTSNTRQKISSERAHLHFELGLRLSDRFSSWHRAHYGKKHNDHGEGNGRNFIGLNPVPVLRSQRSRGAEFSLLRVIRAQRELCRVIVREPDFFWVRRHRPLVEPSAKADRDGVAGYVLVLNFAGFPYRAIPLSPSEVQGKSRFEVLSVNEAEQRRYPCRKLVERHGGGWRLARNGRMLLDLLTH